MPNIEKDLPVTTREYGDSVRGLGESIQAEFVLFGDELHAGLYETAMTTGYQKTHAQCAASKIYNQLRRRKTSIEHNYPTNQQSLTWVDRIKLRENFYLSELAIRKILSYQDPDARINYSKFVHDFGTRGIGIKYLSLLQSTLTRFIESR